MVVEVTVVSIVGVSICGLFESFKKLNAKTTWKKFQIQALEQIGIAKLNKKKRHVLVICS